MGLSLDVGLTKGKKLQDEIFESAFKNNSIEDFQSALSMFQDDTIDKAVEKIRNEDYNQVVYRNDTEQNSPFMKVSNFNNSRKFKQNFIGGISGNNISIGDFGKGVLFNQWGDFIQKTNRADGSVLVPEEILADIVYTASQHSVLLGSCPIIVMNSPTVIVGRVTDDIDLDFKEKGKEGIETDLGLEGIKLEAKTLYSYISITEEDLQDVQNLDSILTNAFSMAVAKALDDNFLYTNSKSEGKPGIYPKGILDNKNIKNIEVSEVNYDMIANANLEISKSNGKANTIGLNPVENFKLQTMKDSIGQYITPPSFYNDLNRIESNGLKPNDIIVFDANQILIGIRKEMDIKVMPNLKNGTVIMRCMLRADVLPIRENHICKITVTG